MAEDAPDDDEKTEEATARRLEKAREDGQVPRSQELGVAAVMISSMAALYLMGGWLIGNLAEIFASGFIIDRREIYSENLSLVQFADIGRDSFYLIIPLLLLTFIVALLAPAAMGGLNFAWKAAAPKASKLNPLSGFKRMFGLKALVELTKSVLKFLLVAGVLTYFVYDFSDELVALSGMAIEPALIAAGEMVGLTTLVVTATLVLIAAIDVPFQAFEFNKRMRMTKQEVKDYIRHIADRRLLQLGLKPIFKQKDNPLPWLDWILNGASHDNFFEKRVTEYSVNGMEGDWGWEKVA